MTGRMRDASVQIVLQLARRFFSSGLVYGTLERWRLPRAAFGDFVVCRILCRTPSYVDPFTW